MIPCECGYCDELIVEGKTTDGHIRRYKRGHNTRGKKQPHTTLRNLTNNPMKGIEIRNKVSGHNSHHWKGDDTVYSSMHEYVREHKPKPLDNKCEICKLEKRLELCNISPTYNRETYTKDFENWFWACSKCHQISDGRADRRHPTTGRFLKK